MHRDRALDRVVLWTDQSIRSAVDDDEAVERLELDPFVVETADPDDIAILEHPRTTDHVEKDLVSAAGERFRRGQIIGGTGSDEQNGGDEKKEELFHEGVRRIRVAVYSVGASITRRTQSSITAICAATRCAMANSDGVSSVSARCE